VPCRRLGRHAPKKPVGMGGASSGGGLAARTTSEVDRRIAVGMPRGAEIPGTLLVGGLRISGTPEMLGMLVTWGLETSTLGMAAGMLGSRLVPLDDLVTVDTAADVGGGVVFNGGSGCVSGSDLEEACAAGGVRIDDGVG